MKLKYVIILLIFTLNQFTAFSQSTSSDSLKDFTIKLIERAIKKSKIKKIAVWDFTDINKENTTFGSHIAELISVYATYVDSIVVMDRQNLKSLLKEHKLKSEGFIDKNTIMELGKFKEVDAVIVGDAIVTDKDFEVIIKILETNQAGTIAADDQYFPIDSKMASKLGIQISGLNNTNNSNSSNKGFNRPLNSNEEYNNTSTVNNECEKKGIGDYCFYNNSKMDLKLRIYTIDENLNPTVRYTYIPQTIFSEFFLKAKESKCIYSLYTSKRYKFYASIELTNEFGMSSPSKVIDEGEFRIDKCKSKTYSIKERMISVEQNGF